MHIQPTLDINSTLLRTVDHVRAHIAHLRQEIARLEALAGGMTAMAQGGLPSVAPAPHVPSPMGFDVDAFAAEIERGAGGDNVEAMAKRFAPVRA